jgi:hypothetical protein
MSRRAGAPISAVPPGLVVGVVLALLLALVTGRSEAQSRLATAEITRVAGTVEVLRKGPAWTQWVPATVKMQLAEGDQIRALAGASAEMKLPDSSTILIAENTRFAVVRLEQDQSSGANTSAFYLMVGKVRAEVTRAAVQLVRTRQSNFTISTPLGVAAVRGTVLILAYDPSAQGQPQTAQAQTQTSQSGSGSLGPATGRAIVVCLPSQGEPNFRAICEVIDALKQMKVILTGGQFSVTVPGAASAGAPVGSASPSMLNPNTANDPILLSPGPGDVPTFQQISNVTLALTASTLSTSTGPTTVFGPLNQLFTTAPGNAGLPAEPLSTNQFLTSEPITTSEPTTTPNGN